MKLSELSPAEGSVRQAYRKGRGAGSGNGKTGGRGHKGQKARSGGKVRIGFEGGQMPLARRLPKRGFNNIFATPLEIINLSALNAFEDGDVVNVEALLAKGILSKCEYGVKILGEGSLTKKLTVQASAFSARTAFFRASGAPGKGHLRAALLDTPMALGHKWEKVVKLRKKVVNRAKAFHQKSLPQPGPQGPVDAASGIP